MLLAASLLVGGGFVWLLKAGALPVVPPSTAWGSVRPWTAVAFTLLFLGIHVLRCTRWALLIPEQYRPKLSLTLSIGLIGYGAQVLLPFRLGEAARPALIHTHTRLPLGTAAGVIGAERVVDGWKFVALEVVKRHHQVLDLSRVLDDPPAKARHAAIPGILAEPPEKLAADQPRSSSDKCPPNEGRSLFIH